MQSNIEIEAKVLLTKEQYMSILNKCNTMPDKK